jgi:flagellar basal body-associated protein FliL
MKKIIILLMAVSIMLTSCGKSAGLSNGGKKADNKSPATNISTSNQLQKIDNNIKQSWKGYAYDYILIIAPFAIIVGAIVVGYIVWIVKNKNKSSKITDPKNRPEPSKMITIPITSDRADYAAQYSSCSDNFLIEVVNYPSCCETFQKQCAVAELEKRKTVPFSIPKGVDPSILFYLSSYTNDVLEEYFERLHPAYQRAINFIFECRKKND